MVAKHAGHVGMLPYGLEDTETVGSAVDQIAQKHDPIMRTKVEPVEKSPHGLVKSMNVSYHPYAMTLLERCLQVLF